VTDGKDRRQRRTARGKLERSGPKKKTWLCSVCGREASFCWSCTCGFMICQACMDENLWGMTCNNVTWECPECGAFRAF